jgi:DNA invertase Pin-like site-specific DNA recombinase
MLELRMSRRASSRQDRPTDAPLRVALYLRVSTSEQADSGAGLEAQEHALRQAAERKGWQVVAVLTDAGASGKSLSGRPALAEALELVESGGADVLAVSKLDRLSRSLLDFAGLMARAHKQGWALVALDVDVDTTTPGGKLVANVMASVAEWERETIGARTRDALAAKRAQGVRLGRPRTLPLDVIERISRERAQGRTLRAIADGLSADKVPTAQGGVWRPGTVAAVLSSQDAQAATA